MLKKKKKIQYLEKLVKYLKGNIMEENEEIIPEVNDIILEHLMNPRNYGQIDDCGCCGIGYDDKSGEFVIVYMNIEDDTISDIKFSAQACQDTIVAGSMFTEMVIGDKLANGAKSALFVRDKIKEAPLKQRACTSLVITAFEACMKNYENRALGIDEELHKIKIQESCEIKEEKQHG